MQFNVSIQVIEVYHIYVEADTAWNAIEEAGNKTVDDIRKNGKLQAVETDYADIITECPSDD